MGLTNLERVKERGGCREVKFTYTLLEKTLVQVLQLGMFTWPTPLKYPESISKYTEAVAEVLLDMDEGYMS